MKKFIQTFTIISVFCSSILQANAAIIITEVLPNPDGSDAPGEFIEIYNSSDTGIDLTQFEIDGNIIIADSEPTLEPNEFGLITKSNFAFSEQIGIKQFTSNFTLANGGDKVEIADENGLVDYFEYSSSTSGKSIVRPIRECNSGSNILTSQVNLGTNWTSIGSFDNPFSYSEFSPRLKMNGTEVNNQFEIDKNNSILFEVEPIDCNQSLNIFKFELNETEISSFPHTANLKSDSNFKITYPRTNFSQDYQIKIKEDASTQEKDPVEFSEDIRINEVYPNPTSGEEWIELYNFGNKIIQLDDWYLTDESGKKTKLDELNIEPKAYLVIEAPELKTSLNNFGDTIYLFSPDDKEISKVTYPEIDKGISYAFVDNKYVESSNATKNAENIIENASSDEESSSHQQDEDQQEDGQEVETERESSQDKDNKITKSEPTHNYQYSTPQTTTIEIIPFNYPEKVFSKVVYTQIEPVVEKAVEEESEKKPIFNSAAFNLSLASSSIYGLYGFEESRRYMEKLVELIKNALKG